MILSVRVSPIEFYWIIGTYKFERMSFQFHVSEKQNKINSRKIFRMIDSAFFDPQSSQRIPLIYSHSFITSSIFNELENEFSSWSHLFSAIEFTYNATHSHKACIVCAHLYRPIAQFTDSREMVLWVSAAAWETQLQLMLETLFLRRELWKWVNGFVEYAILNCFKIDSIHVAVFQHFDRRLLS